MYIEHDNQQTKHIFNYLMDRHKLTKILATPKKNSCNTNHINNYIQNTYQLSTPTTENSLYHSNDTTFGTVYSAAGLISKE